MTDPHLLIFQPLIATCKDGHEVRRWYGGNQALCSCGGFEIAATHRDDVEEAYNVHVKAAQRRQEQVYIKQYQRDISIHEIFWKGSIASCKGCSWMVYNLDRSRAIEAFSNHLETIRQSLQG